MSNDPKDRDEEAHETMPPELRPYAKKPVPGLPLVAPEDEATFKAYLDVLKTLNGGPGADPFHAPAEPGAAAPARAAPPSVRAYVPPTALPAAEAKAREAAPSKVVIVEARPPAALQVTHEVQTLDTRPFREAWEARQAAEKGAVVAPPAATGGDEDTRDEITLAKNDDPRPAPAATGSPWATEAPAPESVRSSALPSSLRPRDVTAEGSAGVAGGRMKAALLVGVLVVVGAVIGVRVATSGPGTDVSPQDATNAALRVTATATGVATGATPAMSAGPAPAASASTSATVEPPRPSAVPVPTVAPALEQPHGAAPRRHHPGDDPYGEDAAAPPSPPKTAEPSPPAVPSTAPSVTTAAPQVTAVGPKAPPTPSSAHPTPPSMSGPILGGSE
jgi:hypothetical protein